jgi:hypothetical protein
LTGRLAPPGVDQLSPPASDEGVSVSPGGQERPLPPATGRPGAAAGSSASTPASGAGDDSAAGAPTTTAGDVTTTTATTAPPGNGATTSVPAPSSTVPDRTRPTGRPSEPPGRS